MVFYLKIGRKKRKNRTKNLKINTIRKILTSGNLIMKLNIVGIKIA
jgi:hypothetical protein